MTVNYVGTVYETFKLQDLTSNPVTMSIRNNIEIPQVLNKFVIVIHCIQVV